jgi:hypothetical protein
VEKYSPPEDVVILEDDRPGSEAVEPGVNQS